MWRIEMANKKFDGLIEAVRYRPDGNIELVRAYERRGATFSDVILIDRARLVTRLKSGQIFVTGSRTALLGSTFVTAKTVQLNGEMITTNGDTSRDNLEEVPRI
jgi:hypothetical protein